MEEIEVHKINRFSRFYIAHKFILVSSYSCIYLSSASESSSSSSISSWPYLFLNFDAFYLLCASFDSTGSNSSSMEQSPSLGTNLDCELNLPLWTWSRVNAGSSSWLKSDPSSNYVSWNWDYFLNYWPEYGLSLGSSMSDKVSVLSSNCDLGITSL
jgi:hypothetical protein